MKIPRLSWNVDGDCFVDDSGFEITFDEVVTRYNIMAERQEVLLDDLEELVNGHQQRAD